MKLLLNYSWPGNVRELENAMERACVTSVAGQMRPENLPPELKKNTLQGLGLPVNLDRPLPVLVRLAAGRGAAGIGTILAH